MTPTGGYPVDRVGYIEYAYDTFGNLFDIVAKTARVNGVLIAQNHFGYDARGNLLKDWQSHGKPWDSVVSPYTGYEWQYQSTGTAADDLGFNRPTQVAYPVHPSLGTGRTVTLAYGTAGTNEYLFSRTSRMTTNLGVASPGVVADFTYTGTGRRSSMSLANAKILQNLNLNNEIGLAGLDPFGRLSDLHYKNTASIPTTLFRAQYKYDSSGNRLSAKLTQAPVGGVSQDNKRSQINRYDVLNRLVGTDVGILLVNPSTGLPYVDPLNRLRNDSWELDKLGNWVTGAAATPAPPGRLITGDWDFNGTPNADLSIFNAVSVRNELTSITTTLGTGTPAQKFTLYDAAGNLIFDGTYHYQYDAWNRLIQGSCLVSLRTSCA